MIKNVTPTDFQFKTEPFDHQREAFMLSRDEPEFAYLMEMGTGKSKLTIDVGAWLFLQSKINFWVVSAPNGVHRNWSDREIPTHLPDWIDRRVCVWSSQMKKADWDDYWSLWDQEYTGLRVLCVNHDAFSAPVRYWQTATRRSDRPRFGTAIARILNAFDVFFIVDESSKIKTPGARRAQRHCTLGKRAPYKRILTCTLGGPLEAYMQFNFLDPEILGGHPPMNFFAYKHHYANWQRERNHRTGRSYEVLTGYKNIDELQAKIATKSYRKKKLECLDLPDKIYMTRDCAMEKEQKRIYDRVKQESILELKKDDERTVANVLVKYLRLQQIMGGWLPDVDNPDAPAKPMFEDPVTNPRIKALMDVIEENSDQQIIIWARFRAEIEAITDILNSVYGGARSFYGGTPKDEREEIIDGFQNGDIKFFVANQHSGGYGLTLTAATCVVYYSNDFSLEARLQSEDRCHRIGQTNKVLYVDMKMPGSLDTRILRALKEKKNLADTVVGDDPSEWF